MPSTGWVSDAIAYEVCEMLGTRTEDCGAEGFEGKVQLKVPYDKRFAVVWDIYMNDMPWPGNPTAFMKNASIQPLAAGLVPINYPPPPPDPPTYDQLIGYSFALINLVYSTAETTIDLQGKPRSLFYIETWEPQVEFQIMSPENFFWGTTPKAPGRMLTTKEAPGRQIRTSIYTVKWLQQPNVIPDFYNLAGSVNDDIYEIEHFSVTAEPETLLFMPGPVEKSIWYPDSPADDDSKQPQPGFNYTCKFAYRPSGWNKYYRMDSAGATEADKYERIKVMKENGTSAPWENYKLASLSTPAPGPTPPLHDLLPTSPLPALP